MKKSIFTLVLSLFLIFLTLEANSQGSILVKLKMPPPGKLNVTDFYAVTLTNNTDSVQSVYLVGTATEEKDGLIARGTTVAFRLKKGTTILKIKDLPKTPDVEYLAKDTRYKNSLIRKGEFPSGQYEVCVSVFSKGTNIELGSDCFSQTVLETGILSLINPSDGQEIDLKTPLIFTWVYSGKMPSDGYTLKIVEVKKGQTQESAMATNKAFFEKKGIRSTTFKYSNNISIVRIGKEYAWMVKAGNVKSEVFTFKISGQNGPVNGDPVQTGIIDFETLDLWEGATIFDQYYNNGAPCGVRFYLGDPADNVYPVLAEVGDPMTAFQHQSSDLMDQFCGQNILTDSDMPEPGPEPGEGVGCWFLTDDGIVSLVADPLNVVYNSPTSQASGFLLDIDGDEQWTITAYDGSGQPVDFIILGSSSPTASSVNCTIDCFNWDIPTSTCLSGDGRATFWAFDTFPLQFERIEFVFTGGGTAVGLAFDNFSPCTIQNNTGSVYCCDGDNLIINGNFEDGANDFTSDYTSTTGIPFPGEYSVIDYNDASSICSEWNVEDHSHCENATGGNNKILAVNGETMQTSNTNSIIWEQTITGIEVDSLYKFCAYLKHLPQCCFDIVPKYNVQINQGSGWTNIVPWTTLAYSGSNSPPCDWELISGTFTAQSSTVSIRIRLDEQGIGDGNDIAIDDISLQKTQSPELDITVVHDGSNNQIEASINQQGSGDDVLPNSCNYWWAIAEASGSPPNLSIANFMWGNLNTAPIWELTTTFPGYTIVSDQMYVVILYLWDCDCYANGFTYQLTYNAERLSNDKLEALKKMESSKTQKDLFDKQIRKFIKENVEKIK